MSVGRHRRLGKVDARRRGCAGGDGGERKAEGTDRRRAGSQSERHQNDRVGRGEEIAGVAAKPIEGQCSRKLINFARSTYEADFPYSIDYAIMKTDHIKNIIINIVNNILEWKHKCSQKDFDAEQIRLQPISGAMLALKSKIKNAKEEIKDLSKDLNEIRVTESKHREDMVQKLKTLEELR